MLYARYNGGRELSLDGITPEPRDAEGFYLDGVDGNRLTIDDGFVEGAVVGYQRIYGLLTAGVIGQPASARRSGFDQCSDNDYGFVAFSTSQLGFIARANRATQYDAIFDSVDSDARAQMGMGAGTNARVRTTETGVTGLTLSDTTGGMAAGTNYLGGYIDGAAGELESRWWDASGAVGASASASAGGPIDVAGAAYLGRQNVANNAWTTGIDWVAATDGAILTLDTLDDIVADMIAGATVDEIKATYSLTVASDGVVTGVKNDAQPTDLYESIGTGPPVTVAHADTGSLEMPAAGVSGGQYLQTDGNLPVMPAEGTLIVALEIGAIDGGGGNTILQVGGIEARINRTTTPDRVQVRLTTNTTTAATEVSPSGAIDADVTAEGLFFLVLRYYNPTGSSITRSVAAFQPGASAADVSASASTGGAYVEAGPVVVGADEGASAARFTGRIAWALLAEEVAHSVLGPQLTDFYSPKLVGLNRGTMVAFAEYATTDGGTITADDVVSGGAIMTGLGWALEGSGAAPTGEAD